MKLKVVQVALVATLFVAIAVIAGWNVYQTQNDNELSDLTLDNMEALAEGKGSFPACQKNEGAGDVAKIPFCVNGQCQQTMQRKGKLDVNYCNQ